jgi:regulatory protein
VSSHEAFDVAARALSRRERTTAQLSRYLAERGFAEDERAAALEALTRTGVVDDARFAESRAAALAERGAGDAFIRHDLRGAGSTDDEIERALDAIAPERDRAERIVERRGLSPKTARYLVGKGFSEDTVGAVVARGRREGLG